MLIRKLMEFGYQIQASGYLGDRVIKLNRQELIASMYDLNGRLRAINNSATIFVYGGFVMCVAYELRDSTMDIDCMHNNFNVENIACEMATEYGWAKNWLNTAVKDIIEHDMIKPNMKFVEFDTLSNLRIVIPTEDQMLAMKLYSAREGTSDFQDAVDLASNLNIRDRTSLRNLVKTYFKESSIRERNKAQFNCVWRFVDNVAEAVASI